MKKNKSIKNDAIKAFRKANREIEMEKNGMRWIAIDRPHKNKKKYNRKRDKRVILDYPFFEYYNSLYAFKTFL